MISTTLDLMRHGTPVGGHKYRGQIDDPLSAEGWAQMRAAVAGQCPWDVIISSPLLRCVEFARELAQRHDLVLELDDRLKEIGFGEWEGCTATELMQAQPDLLMQFWIDPLNHTPPGAETVAAFRDRVVAAWDQLLSRHRGRHLLVVGHAGMVRMIVRHVLEMPLANLFRIQVPNAGLTRIRVDDDGERVLPRLLFHKGSL